MQTFKEYLMELMVDVDPAMDSNELISSVRKQQMLAQRSPQTVAKQQADAAVQQRQQIDTDKTTPPDVKALKTQIARVREQLMRLQQQLVRRQQSSAAARTNQGANNTGSMS